jgi:hypothetical protein
MVIKRTGRIRMVLPVLPLARENLIYAITLPFFLPVITRFFDCCRNCAQSI